MLLRPTPPPGRRTRKPGVRSLEVNGVVDAVPFTAPMTPIRRVPQGGGGGGGEALEEGRGPAPTRPATHIGR
jgi:hypothetical protein